MAHAIDKELAEYRDMMRPPDHFEEGFSWRTIVGAIFLGFVMMPASMYMNLVIGGANIGDAARWVTVILFLEIAKRSMVSLKQQEVYVLYYMAGMVLASPFEGLLFRQYLVTSPAAEDLRMVSQFPSWVAPSKEAILNSSRSFLTWNWAAPIGMIVLGQVIARIDHFGLGYFLYRLTSDVEKLPFPLAPVGAAGSVALAESTQEKQSWRWRTFSIGAVIGLLFGTVYIAVPAVTGAIFGKAVQIIPVPFIELTDRTSDYVPAMATGITLDLALIFVGFVIPFWAVVGGLLGVLLKFVANPIMYHHGILHHWTQSMKTPETVLANYVDFYMSFNIGIALSIAVVGFYTLYRGLKGFKKVVGETGGKLDFKRLLVKNKERGDISIWTSLGIYLFSTCSYIVICKLLVRDFPLWFFIGYGFIYTPIISYATARLEGMAGQAVNIPFVREAGFILAGRVSGYRGIDIWFAPIPVHNYGTATVGFRQIELTGTKLRSIIKTEFLVVPIILVASILFSHFIWSLSAVPSEAYPYANMFWDMSARQQLLMFSSTMGGESPFFDALNGGYVGLGLGMGLVLFVLLSALSLPTLLIYGLVRGLSQQYPQSLITEFVGAMLGRYYFARKFGRHWWRQYTVVLLAGYGCGVGLISAASVAVGMIAKSVTQLSY